jgi:hypothetical protein
MVGFAWWIYETVTDCQPLSNFRSKTKYSYRKTVADNLESLVNDKGARKKLSFYAMVLFVCVCNFKEFGSSSGCYREVMFISQVCSDEE